MNIINELEGIFKSIDSLKEEFLLKSKDIQSKLEEWMPDEERDNYQALYNFLTSDFSVNEKGLLIEILSYKYPQESIDEEQWEDEEEVFEDYENQNVETSDSTEQSNEDQEKNKEKPDI